MFSPKQTNSNSHVTLYVAAAEIDGSKFQQNLTAIGGVAKIDVEEGDYSYVSKASALAYTENSNKPAARVIIATTHEKIGDIQNSLVKVCIRLNSGIKILLDYCDCDTKTTGLIAFAQITASNKPSAIGQIVEIRRIAETLTTPKSYAVILPQCVVSENGNCIG